MPDATRRRQPAVRTTRRYGWLPDLPDKRDYPYSSVMRARPLPPTVDLRAKCPPVYSQGELGSCTAHAIAAALEFDQPEPRFVPSRLFIFYNERVLAGAEGSAGAHLRDGIRSVSTQGACKEDDWPYDPAQDAVQPPQACYEQALGFKALTYYRLDQDIAQFKTCLAEGFPFVFGFTAYASFETEAVKTSGTLPMPQSDETVVGGHAVVAVGYDDASACVIARNSWGPDWGQGGYFMMPYAYITDPQLACDFWTIRAVS